MKKKSGLLLVAAVFGLQVSSFADMIEIKGRGILNGKILAQDEKEVRFEDSAKNLFVVPRADVLFLEVQADAPVDAFSSKASGFGKGGGQMLGSLGDKAMSFYHTAKHFVVRQFRKVRDYANKPLDRSSADSRSKALADSMGELSTHVSSLSKQDKKRTSQLRGLKEDAAQRSGKGKNKTSDGVGFGSLD